MAKTEDRTKKAPKPKSAEEIVKQFAVSVERERVSTNSVTLDKLFGGGLPLGKFVLCSSPEGVGKSTMALWVARSFCEKGKRVLYVDAEAALNPELLTDMGLMEWMDEDHPETAQFSVVIVDTMGKLDELFQSLTSGSKKTYDLVIIDSWNYVQPSLRKDIPIEDVRPGVKAQQDGVFLPKYKTECGRLQMSVWVIAQKRASFAGWQPTYEVAVSNALKFASDCTLELTKKDFFKGDNDKIAGSFCVVEANPKNKLGGPAFEKKPLHIVFRRGISDLRTLTTLMIQGKEYKGDLGPTLEQKGAYYYPISDANPDNKGLQGYEALNDWVKENFDEVVTMLSDRDLI